MREESYAKRELCPKAKRVVEALQASGMEEDQAIATQLEIGKISMVGCTTYREETNKRLMKVLFEDAPSDPEGARRLAKRFARILQIEKQAKRSSEIVAQNFYRNLFNS